MSNWFGIRHFSIRLKGTNRILTHESGSGIAFSTITAILSGSRTRASGESWNTKRMQNQFDIRFSFEDSRLLKYSSNYSLLMADKWIFRIRESWFLNPEAAKKCLSECWIMNHEPTSYFWIRGCWIILKTETWTNLLLMAGGKNETALGSAWYTSAC